MIAKTCLPEASQSPNLRCPSPTLQSREVLETKTQSRKTRRDRIESTRHSPWPNPKGSVRAEIIA